MLLRNTQKIVFTFSEDSQQCQPLEMWLLQLGIQQRVFFSQYFPVKEHLWIIKISSPLPALSFQHLDFFQLNSWDQFLCSPGSRYLSSEYDLKCLSFNFLNFFFFWCIAGHCQDRTWETMQSALPSKGPSGTIALGQKLQMSCQFLQIICQVVPKRISRMCICSLNAVLKVPYDPVRTESSHKENLLHSFPRKTKVSVQFKIHILGNELETVLCVTLKKGSYLKNIHPHTHSGTGGHCVIWAEWRCNGEGVAWWK